MPGLRLVDRYLLREMALPFALALVGFLVFILLLLLGQFSGLLVTRALDFDVLVRLLLYKTPYFLVWAFPIATLFAIVLALGRLGHDRELIALQAAGLSPRRLLLPVVLVGALLSGVAFGIGDTLAPWGNREFLKLYVEQLYGGRQTPQIRDNAFFKGVDRRFFYVRRYDPVTQTLQDVLVYDFTGELALDSEGGRLPKVLTARRARWEGDVWKLQDGWLYAFDAEGRLRYSSRFEAMEIRVGGTIQRLVFEQRTPSELSLGELAERIRAFRAVGRPPEPLLVEYHLKIAIPLACLVFALFGAPLSLLIGPRGRALGAILSVLLVLFYQGLLFWTAQILGTRGDLPPAAGAHLPNALLGLVGLWLLWKADRLSRLDLVERARRLLPLVLALGIAFKALTAGETTGWAQTQAPVPRSSQSAPLTLEADVLRLSPLGGSASGGSAWRLEAEGVTFALARAGLRGRAERLEARLVERKDATLAMAELTLTQSASVELPHGRLSAERIALSPLRLSQAEAEGEDEAEESAWTIEAQGRVRLRDPREKFQASAQRLTLELLPLREGWRVSAAWAEGFSGELAFTNARGEPHRLRYQGARARLAFDERGGLASVSVTRGEFTTCPCAAAIPQAAYSIRAERLFIRPDELLAALGITMRAFGTPVFWAPAYVAPLGDVRQRYPFLPEVGRDARRGWFARWRLPAFGGEGLFGFLLLDVYTGSREVGSGLDLNYKALPGSRGGRLSVYRLVGADEALSLDWAETLQLDERTQLDLSLGLRTGLLAQQATTLLSQATLSGSAGGWSWRVGLAREQRLLGPEPDPEALEKLPYQALERLPELSVRREPLSVELGSGLGPVPVQLSWGLSFGRYREVPLKGPARESARFDGQAALGLPRLSPVPGLELEARAGARLSLYERTRRETLDVAARLSWQPLPTLSVSLAQLDRVVRGRSPFRFDRLAQEHRLTLRGEWRWAEVGALGLSAGYDWGRGRFLPARATVTVSAQGALWGLGARGQLTVEADFNAPALKRITVQALLNEKLSISGGYSFLRRRFDDLIVKLDLGEPLRLGLRFDVNALAPRRASVQARWALGEWAVDLGAEYDFARGRVATMQLGLVRTFCRACWQVGIYTNGERVWLEARINAFPSAEVRFSPTDRSLSFGP